MLIMRDNKTGIKGVTLDNGGTLFTIDDIHQKSILCILIMNDNRNVITGGKDKCVTVTHCCLGKITHRMIHHKDFVTTMALSTDYKYLFTGDKAGNILVYFTSSWT